MNGNEFITKILLESENSFNKDFFKPKGVEQRVKEQKDRALAKFKPFIDNLKKGLNGINHAYENELYDNVFEKRFLKLFYKAHINYSFYNSYIDRELKLGDILIKSENNKLLITFVTYIRILSFDYYNLKNNKIPDNEAKRLGKKYFNIDNISIDTH